LAIDNEHTFPVPEHPTSTVTSVHIVRVSAYIYMIGENPDAKVSKEGTNDKQFL